MSVVRSSWMDLLKAFAIYLVILGHIINNRIKGGYYHPLIGIIYTIHIPLFLMISGYFVKDKTINMSFILSITRKFIIPYTTWTIILSLFYLGINKIIDLPIHDIFYTFVNGWLTNFLWFIKAYLITYLLWQFLQKMSNWMRLYIGCIILICFNLIFIGNKIISELMSLSLYTYSIFAFSACISPSLKKPKNYINLHKAISIICVFLFIIFIPYYTTNNNYFESSFNVLFYSNNWHIFIIRFIGGVSISIFLMSLGYIAKCNTATNCLKLFQNIGQNTLSIYMLQSLLVEAALNRFVQLPNNHIGYITSIFIAIFMTFISWYIIKCTTKIKLLGVLLFGK